MKETETIAILGLGLMGASLGLALKKNGFQGEIRAYARREETRRDALGEGIADVVYEDPAKAVRGVDMVVLCVPILIIPELLERCLPGLGEGTVVTDVGSTKAWVMKRAEELLAKSGALFVGSHPIAGSEKKGLRFGQADLYEGSVVVITPGEQDRGAVKKIARMWNMIGARVKLMTPEKHDCILAKTSHLPHLVAAALALAGGDDGSLCGSGFRDTTRIAEGSPRVWRDIVLTNPKVLLNEIAKYRDSLAELEQILQTGDEDAIEKWLSNARKARRGLLE